MSAFGNGWLGSGVPRKVLVPPIARFSRMKDGLLSKTHSLEGTSDGVAV